MRKKEWINNSRKMYLLLYLMNLILITTIAILIYQENPINLLALIGAIAFIVLSITITEIHRIRNSYKISDTFVAHRKGIFSTRTKDVAFSSLSDIDLEQNFIEKILNYGSIKIYKYGEKPAIIVKNINRPEKFIEILEKTLDNSIKKEMKNRNH